MFVQLKSGWPGAFRRSVKDGSGETLTILEWSPEDRTPMEITDPLELASIKEDIGKSLVIVNPPAFVPEKPADPQVAASAVVVSAKPATKKSQPVVDATNPLKV